MSSPLRCIPHASLTNTITITTTSSSSYSPAPTTSLCEAELAHLDFSERGALLSCRDVLVKSAYRTREKQVPGSAFVASGQVGQLAGAGHPVAVPLASATPLALLASLLPALLAYLVVH